jgi:hypothetical protein
VGRKWRALSDRRILCFVLLLGLAPSGSGGESCRGKRVNVRSVVVILLAYSVDSAADFGSATAQENCERENVQNMNIYVFRAEECDP